MPDLWEQMTGREPENQVGTLYKDPGEMELTKYALGNFKQVDNVSIIHDTVGRIKSIRVFDKESGQNYDVTIDYENSKLIVSKQDGRGGLAVEDIKNTNNSNEVPKNFEEYNSDIIVSRVLKEVGLMITDSERSDIQEFRKNTYLV